jgi:hypothetical protein
MTGELKRSQKSKEICTRCKACACADRQPDDLVTEARREFEDILAYSRSSFKRDPASGKLVHSVIRSRMADLAGLLGE